MRALLGILAVVAIAAVGWFLYSAQTDAPVSTTAEEAADTATEAAASICITSTA